MGVLHSMGSKGDSIEKQTSDYVAKKQELEWRSAPPQRSRKKTPENACQGTKATDLQY